MPLTRRACLIGAGNLCLTAGTPRIASALSGGDRIVGGRAFGTYWRVTLPADADEAEVTNAVGAIVGSVNRAMSPFEPRSEITGFNLRKTTDWIPASHAFLDVAAESLRVSAATGGAFDPTVGPIVGRYGFGPIHGSVAGDYADIEIADRKLRKHWRGLTLDLCGIAKGYALDRMVAKLDGLGLSSFLIELGGEVFARGRSLRVGVENPLPGPDRIYSVVDLEDAAMATSGHRYNSFEVGGRRYSHIVDPRSADPIDSRVASVSVLAPDAMSADAFATGLMVMGLQHGRELAEGLQMPALFLLRDGAGLRHVAVAGFERHVVR